MEDIFINGVNTMPISTLATISFPLDIPQVDVLATKQTQDGKFIITLRCKVVTKQPNAAFAKKKSPATMGMDRR